MDPATSLIMCGLLAHSAVPLLKEAVKVLIMSSSVNRAELEKQILAIPNIAGVHDIHSWTFVPRKEIAHCHVVVRKRPDGSVDAALYNEIHQKVKNVFHNAGVHNVTVAIELVNAAEVDVHACFSSELCS